MYKISRNAEVTEELCKTTFSKLYRSKGFDMRNWIDENADIFGDDIVPYLEDMTYNGGSYKKADFHTTDDDENIVMVAVRLGGITKQDIKGILENQIYARKTLLKKRVILVSDNYPKEVNALLLLSVFEDYNTLDVKCFKVTPYLNNDDIYIDVTREFLFTGAEDTLFDGETIAEMRELEGISDEQWSLFATYPNGYGYAHCFGDVGQCPDEWEELFDSSPNLN